MAGSRNEERIERARAALAADALDRANSEGWRAASAAAAVDDQAALDQVRELARELAERAEGETGAEAEQLVEYCTHCLVSIRAGSRRGSFLGRLFNPRAVRGTKACPDCAETVKAEARVCRFCGYRFDA